MPGVITFDGIPLDAREGYASPRWATETANILFRCDGKRTLAEAVRLGGLDTGRSRENGRDYVKYFHFLERHGLVKLHPLKRKPVLEES